MRTGIIICVVCAILLFAACQSEQQIEFNRYYSSGAIVYQTHCQNCHGANGEGLAALIPPLTDSAFLKKNNNQLACYLQNGLKTPIKINGKIFDDMMPPNEISPVEMAQVLTYITNSFGNKLGTKTIPMVQNDLKGCK